MLSANISSGAAFSNVRASIGNNTSTPVGWGIASLENCGGISPPTNAGLSIGWNYSNGSGENNIVYGISAGGDPRLRISSWNGASLIDTLELKSNNDVKISTGNIIPATAAKGVNFTANTPAAGMTSQLLNWYEEGTWTPSTAYATFVGAASSSGTYTRVGRQVTVNGTLTGATSVTVGASGILTSSLPFNASYDGIGSMAASTNTASGVVRVTGSFVVAVTTMSPVGSITFTATYFV